MRSGTAFALALLVLASGCLGSSGKDLSGSAATPSGDDPTPSSVGATGPPRNSHRPAPSTSPAPSSGGGNQTPPVKETPQAPWPAIDQAKIRPGVQMTMTIGGSSFLCTSNFVFRSADNSTLYLGLAAHCVDGMKIGDAINIDGAAKKATLAYSSWIALGLTNCGGNQPPAACDDDFALAKVDAGDRAKVHPAMLHFGGPTQLADSGSFGLQQRVLFYGNSDLHPQENLNWHEGVVVAPQSGPQFRILTAPPGVPGDSGSGVLTRDGRAAGIFVNICISPCPGQQGVVGLKYALQTAATKGGLAVQLATWQQLDDGFLP
jgi:trypsin-like peptidase